MEECSKEPIVSIPSKCKLWLGLTRPRTLFSSLSSVIIAISYAVYCGSFNWINAILCIIIAITAQISSNIANDWLDFKKGSDTPERLGPDRPISLGWLTEKEVVLALVVSLLIMAVAGIWLVINTTWLLLFVGLAVGLGIFAYSGGPYPLSYHGLGDLAVLVFFGLVPTIFSFYVIIGITPDTTIWHLAFAVGFSSTNILIVNNYRDYHEDLKSGKKTSIVRFGIDFAPRFYMTCGLLSIMLLYPIFSSWGFIFVIFYLLLFLHTYRELNAFEGKMLNKTLGHTARNVFFLSLLVIILLILKK